jgi:hypothetical protein
MARTIADIYDALNASKSSFEELNDYIVSSEVPGSTSDTAMGLAIDVTSKSKVAVWRLWLWIFAVGSWLVETLFDRHSSHINEVIDQRRPHTVRWYADQSKKFQYGYEMTWDDNQYQYANDAPDARIVKYAAASERGGRVMLKVAKDVGGSKAPLTSQEKAAFELFWSKWKDAGVRMEIVSLPADKLKINIRIVRDRLVLDAQNNLLRDPSVNPIKKAIEDFGSSLEFDGILRLSKLVDFIQSAEGVVDVQLNSAYHRADNSNNWTTVQMYVESVAGYFSIDMDNSVFDYDDNVEATVFD